MPDEIVVPLRDEPGTSASTWANPIQRASESRTPSRPSRPAVAAPGPPAGTRTPPRPSGRGPEERGGHHGRSRAPPRMKSRSVRPTTTIGSVPSTIMIATRDSTVPQGRPGRQPADRSRAAARRRPAARRQHGHERAALDQRRIGSAGILPAQQRRHDPQVGRARDRQKLREPLHEPQHDRFEQRQFAPSRRHPIPILIQAPRREPGDCGPLSESRPRKPKQRPHHQALWQPSPPACTNQSTAGIAAPGGLRAAERQAAPRKPAERPSAYKPATGVSRGDCELLSESRSRKAGQALATNTPNPQFKTSQRARTPPGRLLRGDRRYHRWPQECRSTP